MSGGSASDVWSIQAGIDEAGYGPLLGPLTIGYSVFRTGGPLRTGAASSVGPCDWRRLREAVTDDPNQDAEQVVVADSKRVFKRNARGARRLETTALSFFRAAKHAVDSGTHVVTRAPRGLAPDRAALARHPWYDRLPTEVPHVCERGDLDSRTERLGRCLERSGTQCLDTGVVVVPAGVLNDSFAATGNKGATLWRYHSSVIAHLFDSYGDQGLDLTLDRLGGRARYGVLLAQLVPWSTVTVLGESAGDSRYLVQSGDRRMRVRFVQKGDSSSLPVALGSCLAKYARELVMGAFNAYFAETCALGDAYRPTAGYVTDARRWLDEIQSASPASLQNRDCLIRTR